MTSPLGTQAPAGPPSTYQGAQAGAGSGGAVSESAAWKEGTGREREARRDHRQEGGLFTPLFLAAPRGTPSSTCRRQTGGEREPAPPVGTHGDKGM